MAEKMFRLLDQAHYVHYDFSTATKLLEISDELKRRYGNVTNLIGRSKTPRELPAKLQKLQKRRRFLNAKTARQAASRHRQHGCGWVLRGG